MSEFPRELIIYEENKPKVLHALKDGRIDYIALTKWEFMDRFLVFFSLRDSFPGAAPPILVPVRRRKSQSGSCTVALCK